MKSFHFIMPFIPLTLIACNQQQIKEAKQIRPIADSLSNEPVVESNHIVAIPDSIQRMVVDDYPITEKMLMDTDRNGNGAHELISGNTYSSDKAWFINKDLKQMIVVALYTDYYRPAVFHFSSEDLPKALINGIDLNTKDGQLATEKQKLKDFPGFMKQAQAINASYFTSNKGIKLGDSMQKAIDLYGPAEKRKSVEGLEKLEWEYIGDFLYDGKTDLQGKPLAKNSYGHKVEMYFKHKKLIAQVLWNDIP